MYHVCREVWQLRLIIPLSKYFIFFFQWSNESIFESAAVGAPRCRSHISRYEKSYVTRGTAEKKEKKVS